MFHHLISSNLNYDPNRLLFSKLLYPIEGSQRKALPNTQKNGVNNKTEPLTKPFKNQKEIDVDNLPVDNLLKTMNKSMSEFIQKANEATLITPTEYKHEIKPNNISFAADRASNPPEVTVFIDRGTSGIYKYRVRFNLVRSYILKQNA